MYKKTFGLNFKIYTRLFVLNYEHDEKYYADFGSKT
jgi:hypothetical protein